MCSIVLNCFNPSGLSNRSINSPSISKNSITSLTFSLSLLNSNLIILISLGKDFSVNLLFPKQGGESKTYWKIEQIKEDKASFSRCVDIAIKGVSANEQNYYCSFVAGFQVPKDFIHKIDVALNDDMKRFLLLTAQGNNGQVAQVHMHKSIQGNYTKPFLDKMKTVTEEQKCPQLIQKVTDIVPSMIQ